MIDVEIAIKTEDEILQGFITNDKFCHAFMAKTDVRYFESDLHRTVFGWLYGYYITYKKAVKNDADFKLLFEKYRKQIHDEDRAEDIKSLLKRLSKEWDKKDRVNEDHLFQATVDYFAQRSVDNFQEDLESYKGDVNKIKKAFASFTPFAITSAEQLTYFTSDKVFDLKSKAPVLIHWKPKVLDAVIGKVRATDLVAFLGPQKRGKTMFLVYAALQAFYNGRRIWFYSLEMPEEEIVDRFHRAALKYHIYEEGEKEEIYQEPYFKHEDEEDDDSLCTIARKKGMLLKKARAEAERVWKWNKKHYAPGDLNIRCRFTNAFSVMDLKGEIEDVLPEERPEVLVLDYADIMKPDYSRDEKRIQIAKIWSDLRGLAQEMNMAIITASQTNRKGLQKDVKVGEIAEDVSKIGQVTSLVALNEYVVGKEKQENIMVIQQVASRRGLTSRKLCVTQNLTLSKPVIDAVWLDKIKAEEKNEGKINDKTNDKGRKKRTPQDR